MTNDRIWYAIEALRPGSKYIRVGDTLADIGWVDDTVRPTQAEWDAALAAVVLPSFFLARELMAQLTPDDYSAIQTAIVTSAPLGLLWASLLVQGEAPISTASPRCKAGWVGMQQALGAARASEIASALGFEG
jgi:hypothetical protein